MANETDVQNWIDENWDWSKSDYENTEDLLEKLHSWEKRKRGTGSEAYKLIGKLYEQLQVMRGIALEKSSGGLGV